MNFPGGIESTISQGPKLVKSDFGECIKGVACHLASYFVKKCNIKRFAFKSLSSDAPKKKKIKLSFSQSNSVQGVV